MGRPQIRWRDDQQQFFIRFQVMGKRAYYPLGNDSTAAHEHARAILARLGLYTVPGADPRHKPRDRSLDRVCEVFVSEKRPHVTPLHADSIEYYLKILCDFKGQKGRMGDITVELLSRQDLESFVATRRLAGWKPKSLRNAITYAKAALEHAIILGLIQANPWHSVKTPRLPVKPRRILTPDEIEALLALAPTDEIRAMLALIRETSARPNEILRARWEHVRIKARQVLIYEHKTERHTGRPRVLYLSKAAARILRNLGGSSGLIFPGRNGKHHDRNFLDHAVRAMVKGTPLEGVTPYTLRRTTATRWIEKGVNPRVVAELMGNSPSVVLDNYAWPASAEMLKALSKS